ncbi:MuF-like minor capsid protein [Mycobacterium phage MrMagoo]|uniref:MuF-like minor capsid protein n=1 Tax=Mycobacterium phage MrMagoo TaxID=1927020 RepID=A0A1L6BYG2_9CAUD|nr:head maturation protease [Mycobacterium phage MrMagoo]APQ42125.1 MuF-like minor capsid protein [Mycobacterium phage MrMagoo]ARM70200.1 MuF-like minor capsid protein [Mycobacterium phage GardenSalsa]
MTQPQEQKGLRALEAYIAYRTMQHRDDQESIAAWMTKKIQPLWTLVDFNELDDSTKVWAEAVLPHIKTAYLQSQRVAAVWAEDVRYASQAMEPPMPMEIPDVERPEGVPEVRFSKQFIPSASTDQLFQQAIEDLPDNVIDMQDWNEPVTFDPFPQSDVAKSLYITGNYEIKKQMPGPEEDLMRSGLSASTGASVRQTMNGGRNATGNVVKFDRKVVGYARVTDGNPCFYCALLASRGAVFAKSSFNTGGRRRFDGVLTKSDKDFLPPKDGPELPAGYSNVAKVHNYCRCQLRPVYANEVSYARRQGEAHRDEEAQFYFDQWEQVTRDYYWLSNKDQIQKFKDQYQPYKRKSADVTDIRRELQDRDEALSASGLAPFSPQREWAKAQLSQLA